LRPLTEKKSVLVCKALQSIKEEAGTVCIILQKDNGGEFQGKVNNWLKDNHIEYRNTLSYSPQSNGMIENTNKQIRRMIREVFIRENTLNWVRYLNAICENKNNQKSSTTKFTPNQLWKPTNIPLQKDNRPLPDSFDKLKDYQVQNLVSNRIKDLALKKIMKSPEEIMQILQEKTNNPRLIQSILNDPKKIRSIIIDKLDDPNILNLLKKSPNIYQVGDLVRVKMSSLYSQIRKMIKQGDKKYITVTYSPDIYQIDTIVSPENKGYENERYTLKDLNGNILKTQFKGNRPNKERRAKIFFGSELLRVDKDQLKEKPLLTLKQALKLSAVEDLEMKLKEQAHFISKSTTAKNSKEKIDEQPKIQRRSSRIFTQPLKIKLTKEEEYQRDLAGKEFKQDGEKWVVETVYKSKDYKPIICEVVQKKDLDTNGNDAERFIQKASEVKKLI